MSAVVAPILTGDLAGHPLRFFKAPRPGPHLVWHAVDDLHACLGLPSDVRREFRQRLQRDHSGEIETVATDGGIEIIAPHYMAQGLIGAMVEIGKASAEIEARYAVLSGKAMIVHAGQMAPDDAFAFAIAAFRNTNGPGEAS